LVPSRSASASLHVPALFDFTLGQSATCGAGSKDILENTSYFTGSVRGMQFRAEFGRDLMDMDKATLILTISVWRAVLALFLYLWWSSSRENVKR